MNPGHASQAPRQSMCRVERNWQPSTAVARTGKTSKSAAIRKPRQAAKRTRPLTRSKRMAATVPDFLAVQRSVAQCGPVNNQIQQIGQSGTDYHSSSGCVRGFGGPSVTVSAARSLPRWRRTIAAAICQRREARQFPGKSVRQ